MIKFNAQNTNNPFDALTNAIYNNKINELLELLRALKNLTPPFEHPIKHDERLTLLCIAIYKSNQAAFLILFDDFEPVSEVEGFRCMIYATLMQKTDIFLFLLNKYSSNHKTNMVDELIVFFKCHKDNTTRIKALNFIQNIIDSNNLEPSEYKFLSFRQLQTPNQTSLQLENQAIQNCPRILCSIKNLNLDKRNNRTSNK